MALATQCPHCGTIFRVAADQLKLRGGIVRCGACNEVFDGNASLIDPQAPTPTPAPEPQAPSASDAFDAEVAAIEASPPAADDEPIYTLDFDTTFDPYNILPQVPQPAPEPEPEPEPVIEEIDTGPLPHEVLDLAGEHSELPLSEPSPASLLMRATATPEDALPAPEPVAEVAPPSRKKKKRPPAPKFEAEPEPIAEVDEPEFVKRSRLEEEAGRTRRLSMIGGSVLLVLVLLAQGIHTFRNVLAASYPALKPALTAVCELAGCRIELPAQIDTLSIETGELQTLGANTFSFTTLLRNGSDLAQAWPHIELTLNDSNDKPVVRRVFAPADYLPKEVAAAKGFPAHSEQPVKLYFELDQLKASGYHLAIFYP